MKDDTKPGWFTGAAVDLSARMKLLFFFLLALLSITMCFSQFGIMSYGDWAAGELNFVLLLIPGALAVAMLGFVPGVLVGLVAGVFLMLRASWSPTSYFDMYLSDPMLSIASLVVGALLMAAVVTPAARHWRSDQRPNVSVFKRISAPRIISIVVGCFLFSLVFSLGARGAVYFIIPSVGAELSEMAAAYMGPISLSEAFLEALVNAVILSAACIVSEILDANRRAGSWGNSLSSVFNRWMLLAMALVFMFASAVSFCAETVKADRQTGEAMDAELDYVQQQISYHLNANAPLDGMLDGYAAANSGTVYVVHDDIILTSNDPEYVGRSVVEALSDGDELAWEMLRGLQGQFIAYDTEASSYVVMKLQEYGAYLIVAFAPLPETYAARTTTLLYNAAFFLLLFAVVFIVARRLLRNVVVAPIHRTNDTLELITGGDLGERVSERRVSEFEELSTGINTTVSALRDTIADVEAKMAQELTTAKAIQESALPRDFPPFPEIDRFDIYASMKTAKEVGGDFYDFFLIDEGLLGFVMADVSGKGIPAALFMMTAKTQIENYMMAGLSLREAIDAANHQLCIGNDAGMFVTTYACVLDYNTGELTYVNAGHNPPLLLHEGSWDWMRDVSGMPLGLFDGIPYEQFTRQLEPGDVLYLYTDGVTEAMNQEGELFSEERLEATLAKYASMNPRSISVGVRRAITEFTLDCDQSDDITMLCLKYGVPPEHRAVMILRAETNQLVHVFNFIHEELRRRGAPKSVYNPLDIAAEELFVNVCHYAYPDATADDPGEVRIGFEYAPNPATLTIMIEDDGIPYNPIEKPDAVTPDDVMDVPIGGLGILMAKRSVDTMDYRREGETNVLTFAKSW